MDLEKELSDIIKTEIARELILQRHDPLDEALFAKVMTQILREGGTGNAFDAPILYELNDLVKGMT